MKRLSVERNQKIIRALTEGCMGAFVSVFRLRKPAIAGQLRQAEGRRVLLDSFATTKLS